MPEKHLEDLAHQIERALQSDDVSEGDRSTLAQVQSELHTALATPGQLASSPATLRQRLAHAVDRLEGEHPRLTELLSKALDALSDVGI